jgi:hypothetical protein
MNCKKLSQLTAVFLALFIGASTIVSLPQLVSGFSWPCIDKTDGKAPMTFSGNNLYVAWWGNGTGNYEVMFKASNDNGKTFGDKINLSNSKNGTSVGAAVAAAGNNVYVIANGAESLNNITSPSDVFIRTSNDGGKTFGQPINLSNSKGIQSTRAEIEASGDNVSVSWWEKSGGKDAPVMRVSNDGGKTFGELIKLTANSTVT